MSKKLMTKNEMMMGTATEAGSTSKLNTGSWRTYAPLTNFDECISCMMCWAYCPDSAVAAENSKKIGTDYQFCKGCGVCAVECPKDCIEMKLDSDVTEEEEKAEQPQSRG